MGESLRQIDTIVWWFNGAGLYIMSYTNTMCLQDSETISNGLSYVLF